MTDSLPSPKPDPSDGVPMPGRIYAIIAVTAGNILAIFDATIINVALPTIARDLHVDASSSVLVVTVYQLALAILVLPLSSVGAKIGLARLYQIGQAIFTLFTLLSFFTHSLPFLLCVRTGQAIGAAAVLSVSPALIRSIYPSNQLGRGLSFNTVVLSATSTIAPTVGGLVLAFAPWQWIFALILPFSAISLLFGRTLPKTPLSRQPYDYQSALLSAGTFGLLVIGLQSTIHGGTLLLSAAIMAGGIMFGVFFVRRELRVPLPIMPVDLLKEPVIALASLGTLCAQAAGMLLLVTLPFRLQHHYGFSPEMVGGMLAPLSAISMIAGPVAGVLSDRVPAGILGAIGMAIIFTSLLFLAWLPIHPGFLDIAWPLAVYGLGAGLYFSPTTRLIVGSAPRARIASAGGLTAMSRLLGQTLGATLAAVILAHHAGGGAAASLIAAGLTLAALLCCLARIRPTMREPAPEEVEDVPMSAVG